MDIRQLKAFIAVFEERNITSAAQRLALTQPTLSVTVRKLEEELGVTLFTRQARGVEVSQEARKLYPQARQMVATAEGMKHMFRQREDRPPLTLGVEGDVGPRHVEAFLRAVYAALPHVALTLAEGCFGDARLAVEEARCEDELFLPLWNDPFVLALPHAAVIDFDASAVEAGWITCPGQASHQRLIAVYGDRSDAIAAQAGSLMQALSMVAAGVGRALLPHSLVQDHPGVRIGMLVSALPTRRVGLCYASRAMEMPVLRQLHDHLRDTDFRTQVDTHCCLHEQVDEPGVSNQG